MLKTELHTHTDQDPKDRIPHSTTALIDRAADLGYHALAVTLHDRYFDPAPYRPYARERGLVLLPGIERTIARRHVLLSSSLGRRLDSHAGLIDAVELNAMYTRRIDFNRRALAWARTHGKPLVGNTDLHRLDQLGTTYSLVDADPDPDAICEAIRGGRVDVRTEPIALTHVGWTIARMAIGGVLGRLGAFGRRRVTRL